MLTRRLGIWKYFSFSLFLNFILHCFWERGAMEYYACMHWINDGAVKGKHIGRIKYPNYMIHISLFRKTVLKKDYQSGTNTAHKFHFKRGNAAGKDLKQESLEHKEYHSAKVLFIYRYGSLKQLHLFHRRQKLLLRFMNSETHLPNQIQNIV